MTDLKAKQIDTPHSRAPRRPVTLEAPAHWASYLVNDDPSGIEPADLKEINDWKAMLPEYASVVSTSGVEYVAIFNGKHTLVTNYVLYIDIPTHVWDVEMTDTFGGQANYSWVKRETIELAATATKAQIVRLAKKVMGVSSERHRTVDEGDSYRLSFDNQCKVMFISFREEV